MPKLSDVWADDEEPEGKVHMWAPPDSDGNLAGDPPYPGKDEAGPGLHVIIGDEVVTADEGAPDE